MASKPSLQNPETPEKRHRSALSGHPVVHQHKLITTVLVNNIHCASCVSHIWDVLSSLRPRPDNVSASIVTHQVRVQHGIDLSLHSITKTLQNAGFEVHSAVTEDASGTKVDELENLVGTNDGWLEQAADRWSKSGFLSPRLHQGSFSQQPLPIENQSREKRKRHIENCSACQLEQQKRSEKGTSSPQIAPSTQRQTRWGFWSSDKHDGKEGSAQELLGRDAPSIDRASTMQEEEYRTQSVLPLGRVSEKREDGKPTAITSTDTIKDFSKPHKKQNIPSQPQQNTALLNIGGMTCSSCTSSITNGLKQMSFVRSVDVSLLTNSAVVTFEGSSDRVEEIVEQVEDLGYECSVQSCEVTSKPSSKSEPTTAQPRQQSWKAVLSIGGMTCASCTGSVTSGLEEIPWITSVDISLLTNSATVQYQGEKDNVEIIRGTIEDLGFECSVQETTPIHILPSIRKEEPTKGSNIFKATLAIEGMTCASCTSSVTKGLKELDFMKNVDVTLLTNSASVIFQGKKHLDDIVGKIEDLGFGCSVDSVEEVKQESELDSVEFSQERTVMIKVDGMFCEHCPPRVLESLRSRYGDSVHIETSPTLKSPLLKLSYTVNPPQLTIRSIISTVQSTNDAFSASVYHPPSLEDRSKAMQLHERQRILIRLVLSIIVAIPTLLIGVVWMSLVPSNNKTRMFFEEPIWAGTVKRSDWALFFLATPVMFFAADVFHTRAIKEIKALWRRGSKTPVLRRFYRFGSMNMLLSAGTSVAYFSSIALIIMGAVKTRPISGMSSDQSMTYFDSVVFLTMFILVGRFLEAYSKAKTGDAVSLLGKLRPTEALLVEVPAGSGPKSQESIASSTIEESAVRSINVDLLEVGDIVRVPNGASPPSDGIIILGESSFDESSLTGEALPVSKASGDEVFAGTVNCGKPVSIKITGPSGNSMLDQIVKVVREGQTKRAPVERVADIITGYFVPVITLIAIITFAIWLSLGLTHSLPSRWLNNEDGGWSFWSLQFAIAVFVVACPCGIGLAAPTALFVGSGLAAQHGILVKGGGEAFQEASNLDAIVFDKTGTLTEGSNPQVTDHEVFVTKGSTKEKVTWALMRALEESSSHPIAKAIYEFSEAKERLSLKSVDVEELPGYGLRGTFTLFNPEKETDQTYEATVGSEALMDSLEVKRTYFTRSILDKWKSEGSSLALLAVRRTENGKRLGAFSLAAAVGTRTPIRPSALPCITALQRAGLGVYMLTGDNTATAQAIGSQLNIPVDNIISEVLPTEKSDKVRWLQSHAAARGGRPSRNGRAMIAMVGDGINDAPALAAADVSIAVSSGTGVAMSASKFILISSDLGGILTLVDLSKTVFNRVKINFGWALVYNCILVPIAAGVLMGVGQHGVRLGPVWASAAMAASSISVVCSSLALRWRVPVLGWRQKKIQY